MHVQIYLHFNGRCEEAIQFYRQAAGAEVEMLMRYGESPEPLAPGVLRPGMENWIMHASFRIGDSMLMASDDCTGAPAGFEGFQLSLGVADRAEAESRFAALSAGGKVTMPLAKTFFSPSFGMLVDRFGVHWMVIARQ